MCLTVWIIADARRFQCAVLCSVARAGGGCGSFLRRCTRPRSATPDQRQRRTQGRATVVCKSPDPTEGSCSGLLPWGQGFEPRHSRSPGTHPGCRPRRSRAWRPLSTHTSGGPGQARPPLCAGGRPMSRGLLCCALIVDWTLLLVGLNQSRYLVPSRCGHGRIPWLSSPTQKQPPVTRQNVPTRKSVPFVRDQNDLGKERNHKPQTTNQTPQTTNHKPHLKRDCGRNGN